MVGTNVPAIFSNWRMLSGIFFSWVVVEIVNTSTKRQYPHEPKYHFNIGNSHIIA